MRISNMMFAPLLLLLSSASLAGEVFPVAVTINPVMVDGEAIAPGGAVAQIRGLKKGGDGFVSVRDVPSTRGRETDRLTEGTYLIRTFAERAEAGTKFVGVVYDLDVKSDRPMLERCGIPEARPYSSGAYKGPCKSGWVAARFVKILAD